MTIRDKWETRTGEDPGLSHSLDLLSDTYNYNHWIYSLCRPWLGKEVLEVGAGIGNLTQFLLGAQRLVCVEPEPEYKGALEDLARTHLNMKYYGVPVGDIPVQECGFDSALCVNVLEHIEDEEHAISAMASRINSGGHIVLYVPAVAWAYGVLDEKLGHYRRYNRRRLHKLAKSCGLSVRKMHYVNFIGLFGWWWCGRVKKEALIDPDKARFMDRLVPFVSACERVVRIPAGQSLLAVLAKQ